MTPEQWSERWPHFNPLEVLSPVSHNIFIDQGFVPLNLEAMDELELLRKYVGKKFFINMGMNRRRGYRTPSEHTRITGAKAIMSPHCMGLAFDITVEGLSPQRLAEIAMDSGAWTGVGIYSSFTHLDRWDRLGDGTKIIWDKR